MTDHGDEGFSQFYLAEYRQILGLMTMMLSDRETARDVTQEAFVKLYVHWRKVSRYDKPGAWVRRIAIREANRAVRSRRRRSPLASTQAGIGASESLDLRRSIAALPMAQRTAVLLHYLEDRPISDVAEIMGCSESTVRVHLHRARHRLAEQLNVEVSDAAE